MPHACAPLPPMAGPWRGEASGERADKRYGEGFATQVFINTGVTHLISGLITGVFREAFSFSFLTPGFPAPSRRLSLPKA
jgi:hypothetical protein